VRQRVLHPEPYGLEIDRDDAIEHLLAALMDRTLAATDAGVVVHDVEPAEFVDGGAHEGLDIL
jgi:vancomycin resistance protein YoaR